MKKNINLSGIISLQNKRHELAEKVQASWIAERYKAEYRAELEQVTETLGQKMDELNAVIRESEGRARERKLTADQVLEAIREAEKAWNLPKKWLNGVKINVDIHAQNFSSRYKGIPESTQFAAEHRGGKWYLTGVDRDMCSREGHNIAARIPDETLNYIAERAKERAMCIAL